MINFRFHIVSLVAVFLALALGIVMGSTVIDRGIVDQLNRRLDVAERNSNEVRGRNNDLSRQLDEVGAFAAETAPVITAGKLRSVSIMLVAVRGTDGADVKATVDVLRGAGANVPAVIWLEPAWLLAGKDDTDRLTLAVGGTAAVGDELRHQALAALVTRLVGRANARADIVPRLIEGGFVAIDTAGGARVDPAVLSVANSRAVVIGDRATAPNTEGVGTAAVRALVDEGEPVAFAEVLKAAAIKDPRGAVVGTVRRDHTLSLRVATVDDLETVPGRVALVLALSDLGRGVVGHYGVGPGAKRQLPESVTAP
jgi:hypothetical protein